MIQEVYQGEGQAVLRCGLCNKPFDSPSSLKRHGYYCSARKGGRITKARSCLSCASRKTRCDSRRPQCANCISKDIKCEYPAKSSRIGRAKIQSDEGKSLCLRQVNADIQDDSTVVSPNHHFADVVDRDDAWDSMNIDFIDPIDLHPNDEIASWLPVDVSVPMHDSKTTLNTLIHPRQLFDLSIPASPSYNVRSLVKRSNATTGSHKTLDLIWSTLKSYPLMLLRHKVCPPFIHQSSMSGQVEVGHSEGLENCFSLVRMISGEVRGSRKLFWTNVRLECERWRDQHSNLDKWELLGAMQALLVYILIRLEEGETESNNLDSLLLVTVVLLSHQINRIHPLYSPPSLQTISSPKSRWREWIYDETARRLCVVYQIINMIVYFEPAAMCDHPELVLAPLPARKQLWEARDEFEWKAEDLKGFRARSEFGLAANGELATLRGDPISGNSSVLVSNAWNGRIDSRSSKWEEWCAGMDGLGSLVMLTASLLD